MFLNKSLLRTFSKFSKYRLESRLDAFSFRFGAKAAYHLKSPKSILFKNTEINGFQETFSLYRKWANIKTNARNMSNVVDDKCWNCKEVLQMKDFFCALCGALQYPNPNVNFFQLLGISQMYDINLEELSKKFKNLQMNFHPDKFVNKPKEELEISESYSRLINKAYTTLKDPLARGFYLLELQKIPSEACQLKQEFLLNIMEKNEELEAIDKLSVLTKFMQINNEEIRKKINLVKESFLANRMENAKKNLLELNYFINLDAKIKEKQNTLNSKPDT